MDDKSQTVIGVTQQSEAVISPRIRKYIIIASLLALFLGALDALVMSAATPTIVDFTFTAWCIRPTSSPGQ